MKWYFKDATLIVAFLLAGPFMLPLVWFNPKLSVKSKIFWTIVILVITFIIAKQIAAIISLLKEQMELLKSVM